MIDPTDEQSADERCAPKVTGFAAEVQRLVDEAARRQERREAVQRASEAALKPLFPEIDALSPGQTLKPRLSELRKAVENDPAYLALQEARLRERLIALRAEKILTILKSALPGLLTDEAHDIARRIAEEI